MPTRDELPARISIDPQVCFGKPCIRSHRIWVSLILDFLAGGANIEEILAEYPAIEEADVCACIAYGAEMAREPYLEFPARASGGSKLDENLLETTSFDLRIDL